MPTAKTRDMHTTKVSIPIFRKGATDLHANYTHGAGDVHGTHPCPHHLSALTVSGEGHRAGSLAVTLRPPKVPRLAPCVAGVLFASFRTCDFVVSCTGVPSDWASVALPAVRRKCLCAASGWTG